MRICDAAKQILIETDNPAVSLEDTGLIGLIAKRAGKLRDKEYPSDRHVRIINALSKQPGNLVPNFTLQAGTNRRIRLFRLP